MPRNLIQLILSLAGALLFNLVFWQEKLALNAVLFDAFIIGSLFYLYPTAVKKESVRWLLLAHLICVASVVIHNTILSKISLFFTLILFTGFAEYIHRSAWFAAGSMFVNFGVFVATFVDSFSGWSVRKKGGFPIGKIIRFAIFPLGLLGIFLLLYTGANKVFAKMIDYIAIPFSEFMEFLFSWSFFPRLMFTAVGLYVVGSLLMKAKITVFEKAETFFSDQLARKRKKSIPHSALQEIAATVMGKFAKGMLALKNENLTGIISLVLLNVLLLIVNVIDILYVWLNYEYAPGTNLSEFVHEGTGALILSILLAMAVLLFFFRGNLNFYKKNKWLKYGATAWIIQNLVLVISVAIRDYYYITHYGLAYKRIGVIAFLLMVVAGLVTVLIKVYTRKTGYFLFRVNAWAFIFLFVFSTTIHWDELIAAYNIKNKNSITLDIPFLMTLSDKTLPLIDQHIEILRPGNVVPDPHYPSYDCENCFTQRFEEKKKNFLIKQKNYSWLSWNYSDAYTERYLQEHSNKLSLK